MFSFIEPLLALTEYMYFMCSTPLSCCSIGVATDCSTVIASPPTNVALIAISGGTILGYCATGRLRNETTPTITMMIAITMATIGRLMENFDIENPPELGLASRQTLLCSFLRLHCISVRLGQNLGALPHILKAFHNYLFACLQAVRHYDHLTECRSDFNGADLCFSVRTHHRNLVTALQLRHGLLRTQQCIGDRPDLGARRRRLSGSQRELGIREADRYLNSSSLGIDLPIYESELSLM